ncbi:MAG: endonuclease/exonuclease/phosphatase family protein [Candidatus Marinimicrobia bacterium]|nr:endonuclease/exonuclease/phosphatase family protein [Candidatus Neomarinimicrobiota bacterium]
MTYNIRHGVGMDRVLDLTRTARVIQAGNADFVILNEVDHGTNRSFGILQADSLGRLLDMYARFGRSIDYDGGQYGNALLSRYPILNFTIIDLSTDTLLEGRSVFQCRIEIPDDTLTIMGTHLGLKTEEQEEQIEHIVNALKQSGKLILAGDFNFESNAKAYDVLTSHLADGQRQLSSLPEFTFPADEPVRRIDYIFVGSDIQTFPSQPILISEISSASDHRPQRLHFHLTSSD